LLFVGEEQTRQVTIHAAKTNLSKLIETAISGEEVIIAKGSKPMVSLVPVVRGAFRIGLLQDALGQGPDFFGPMAREELALWEGDGDSRSA
jgi:antitoxin (DNA-binding transcriptional repressor) of toxin-antitoxin stability system